MRKASQGEAVSGGRPANSGLPRAPRLRELVKLQVQADPSCGHQGSPETWTPRGLPRWRVPPTHSQVAPSGAVSCHLCNCHQTRPRILSSVERGSPLLVDLQRIKPFRGASLCVVKSSLDFSESKEPRVGSLWPRGTARRQNRALGLAGNLLF